MSLLEAQLDKHEVLEDNDQIVIEGFMDRYNVDYDEAKEILIETKKFLELAAETTEDGGEGVFIDRPLLIIDEMWHTFILHTRQYFSFCYKSFNRFIHHVPTTNKEKEAINLRLKTEPSLVLKESEEKLKQQYSRIYDKYGPETLLKWYETWAIKYTPEYIEKIKKAV
ncbi:MAG: hypothetical protein RLO81_18130 [Fulvivirga sp.]|uniref:hypothetical protein n=1 Tax=Fulvivirga sp. TaxID=1931237 RepID=UPI0032F02169